MASELADQLLPSITTVEIKPDMLNGPDLIAWRSDLRLGAEGDTHMPATLVVLNPGDVETSQPATAPSRRILSWVAAALQHPTYVNTVLFEVFRVPGRTFMGAGPVQSYSS